MLFLCALLMSPVGMVEGGSAAVRRFVNAEEQGWLSIHAGGAYLLATGGDEEAALVPTVSLVARTGAGGAYSLQIGSGTGFLGLISYYRVAPYGLEPYLFGRAGFWRVHSKTDVLQTKTDVQGTLLGLLGGVGAQYNVQPWLFAMAELGAGWAGPLSDELSDGSRKAFSGSVGAGVRY